jgi:hypothetical protein
VIKELRMMNRFAVFVFAATLVTAACTDDNPSSPSGSPKPTISAELLASNENPPIANAESSGRGNATVTFDITRGAGGSITAATATFVVNLSDFPPGTPIRIAHIHGGAAGVNGSILVDTGLVPGDNLTLTNGSGSFTRTATVTNFDVLSQILANPSAFYFNAHSALNPGGVVRGQLARVQ